MARKAVAEELSRERIMEVARELFASVGYRHVSMRSIAKQLGYSHGALYYHFKEKAELFSALISEDFKTLGILLENVFSAEELSQADKLEKVMLEFIRFGLEHPHHYEIMFLINDTEMKQYSLPEQQRVFRKFSLVVQGATSSFEPDPTRLDLPSTLFLSVHGFVTHFIQSRQTYEQAAARAEEHVRFLCRGLT